MEAEAQWRPKRTFTSTDPSAVKLAELLHEIRNPHLTILFGSRARGDYAEGHSGVDIMFLEDQPPDDETVNRSTMAFRQAKSRLYRGQDNRSDWIIKTQEEFRNRFRAVDSVEAKALNDGYIIGRNAEYYIGPARWRETNYHTRWANTHLQYPHDAREGDDERQGSQAYLAVSNALKAAVNAAGEWCPELHDVAMLLELAKKAHPKAQYVTTVDPEIYTQYGNNRREIPPHTPFTSRPEHRNRAAHDVRALLARTEKLKAAWPPPEGEGAETRSRATTS